MKTRFFCAILLAIVPALGADVIPGGTRITIRTIDKIDSKQADLNRRYRASVDEAVMVDGQELVRRGSDAELTIAEARQSGKISGRAALVLRLSAVSINGRMVSVDSGDSVSESGSQGKKAGTRAAVGAAGGAILGGIFGGGKGAAIGAGAGAAAGTATAIGGEKVTVAPETRLTFTLRNDAAVR
jgi:hypothetical protein